MVLPLPLHTTSLKPSSLKSIFASLSSLPLSSLPDPVPRLAPDILELQRRVERTRAEKEKHESGEVRSELREKAEVDEVDDVDVDSAVNEQVDREMIYIAIVASDSTTVYYKLSKGIRKPADIPDE